MQEITVTNFDEQAIDKEILKDTASYGKVVAQNKALLNWILAVEELTWVKLLQDDNSKNELTKSARTTHQENHNYIGTSSVLNVIVRKKLSAIEGTIAKVQVKKMQVNAAIIDRAQAMIP